MACGIVIEISYPGMPDSSEISALKSSLRGALSAAESLASLRDRIEALVGNAEIPSADLDALLSLSAANATAASALRGLVETLKRRSSSAEARTEP